VGARNNLLEQLLVLEALERVPLEQKKEECIKGEESPQMVEEAGSLQGGEKMGWPAGAKKKESLWGCVVAHG